MKRKGPLGQYLIVELEKETENTTIINGKEIWLDTELERAWHARQYGNIIHPTLNPKPGYKKDNVYPTLKEGEKVYFHHFVMDERFQQRIDSVEDKKTYKAHIDQVYCVIRKGEPVMLQDFIFVEPVIEPEENYMSSSGFMIKPEPEVMEREGVVRYVNEFSEDLGVKVGDHIYFESGCNYEIDVEGKKYYRMRNENVLFKYE